MSPQLSVVIPAFNEAERIVPSLQKVREFIQAQNLTTEVIVVNDGSKDGTAEAVKGQISNFKSPATLQLLENPSNRGKGYSVRNGILRSTGDLVLFSDSDFSSPIEEYHKLAAPLKAREASIAIGSRAVKGSQVLTHQPWIREYSGRCFNLVVRAISGLPFRDTQCGFKLFTRQAADAVFRLQTVEGFGFDVEILYIARKLGLKTVEVPVVWNDTKGTRVRFLSDGAHMLMDLMRVHYQDLNGKYNGTLTAKAQRH
jgi:glycosyltransferase involved in cell wall biosynthesis